MQGTAISSPPPLSSHVSGIPLLWLGGGNCRKNILKRLSGLVSVVSRVYGGKMRKLLLIILFAGLLIGTASAEIKRYTIPVEGSPSFGQRDAPLTIVEFIDYQ